MSPDIKSLLMARAKKAAQEAYCPYSDFRVGASVLTANGAIFTGCNVENASYGLTICAERVAIFSARAAGDPVIRAMAIYTPTIEPSPSCGACRQVLSEQGTDIEVVSVCDGSAEIETSAFALLPRRFTQPLGHNEYSRVNSFRPYLAIDIDNVIAQTDVVMRQIIREHTKSRVDFAYEEISAFDYCRCVTATGETLSVEDWDDVHQKFSQSGSILSLNPIAGAQTSLSKLSEVFELCLVTSRRPSARPGTAEWLERHNFPKHSLLFIGRGKKHEFVANAFAVIEDDAQQAVEFCKNTTAFVFLLDHPWNRDLPKYDQLIRVTNWDDISNRLMNLFHQLVAATSSS